MEQQLAIVAKEVAKPGAAPLGWSNPPSIPVAGLDAGESKEEYLIDCVNGKLFHPDLRTTLYQVCASEDCVYGKWRPLKQVVLSGPDTLWRYLCHFKESFEAERAVYAHLFTSLGLDYQRWEDPKAKPATKRERLRALQLDDLFQAVVKEGKKGRNKKKRKAAEAELDVNSPQPKPKRQKKKAAVKADAISTPSCVDTEKMDVVEAAKLLEGVAPSPKSGRNKREHKPMEPFVSAAHQAARERVGQK